MNIFALSSVFNSRIYPEKRDNKIQQQLFATKPDSVSFGAKEKADINFDWIDDKTVRETVQALLAPNSTIKTIPVNNLKKIYRYFGYNIPSGQTKKRNKGSSGNGSDHGFKHFIYNEYITINGRKKETDPNAVNHLKNALRILNKTNGELMPEPDNLDGNKTTISEEQINEFVKDTADYDAYREYCEKNPVKYKTTEEYVKSINPYRAKLEEAKAERNKEIQEENESAQREEKK